MRAYSIALAYLKDKPLNSVLHISMMALGMMLMTALILLGHQLEQRLYRDSAGVDLVVGAKGSPLQLILSSVQHVDIPTGNIPLKEARTIQKHSHIKQAIPLSLGDSYRGHRIVGTEPAYLKHFNAKLAQGEIWKGAMQAVIGSQVATKTGLKLGDSFTGNHGLMDGGHAHDESRYQITGILQKTGTVLDRLIVTSLESVWDLHSEKPHREDEEESHDEHAHHEHNHHEEHEEEIDEKREITALLVTYRNRSAVMSFPRYVNQKTSMQAASPAFEMARLLDLIGVGSDTLLLFGGLLVAVSLASVFIALLNSIRERQHDLAIFRTLGASRATLFHLVLTEGLLIALIGSLIGWGLGHLILELLGTMTEKGQEIGLTGMLFLPSVLWLWLGVMIASSIACIIPAWHASKTEIFTLLQRSH
ncbi:MAG: ABC transporter permease [Rickettsiales bacterium]|nr:ABC transporter permease [Rickettsiales bacterium]